MTDSYPNFFCTAEHKVLAYSQEPDSPSRSIHRSEDDKQNKSSIGYLGFHATFPRTSK
jgi:hypothetical protein